MTSPMTSSEIPITQPPTLRGRARVGARVTAKTRVTLRGARVGARVIAKARVKRTRVSLLLTSMVS